MPKSNLIRSKGENKELRWKHKHHKCCCGDHNADKKRILWKQGKHKSNKSIKYKEATKGKK